MKFRQVGLILLAVLSLTSCGDNKTTEDVSSVERTTFQADSYSIRKENENEELKSQEDEKSDSNDTDGTDYEYTVAQVKLKNSTNTKDYVIKKDDIVSYDDRTFHDLYKCLSRIKAPYSVNEMANFITKTYAYDDKDIYAECVKKSDLTEDYDMEIDDDLAGIDKYDELEEQYGAVEWKLDVFRYGREDTLTLYGNNKYILAAGYNNDIIIDMNKQ